MYNFQNINDQFARALSMVKVEDVEYQNILQKLKEEFDEKWNKKPLIKNVMTIDDFERYRTLGTGSFGRVILAKEKTTNKYFAIKVLDKARIVKLKQVQHTIYEKHILMSINFPFVVFMEYSFKDNSYIYFVLPFVSGGEMFTHLRRLVTHRINVSNLLLVLFRKRKFDEGLSRFYAAQVLLTLEYLHRLDLVYRDLKPENILIDCDGYLRVTDFGFCKMVKGRTWTLCGTPEYLAPEIILCKGYGQSADWWSFGVLIYEMSAGYPPFYSHDSMKIYEKIVSGKFKFAQHFTTELKDLLRNILQIDLSRRYGNLKNGANDIKTHKWFRDVNWLSIYHRKVPPPFKPTCKNPGDSSNFETYDEEPLKVASLDQYSKEFEDL
ncbi:hypothetical protein RN001_007709 [Aquatica leii]|uniref:cAMP-dependent protein kinase n=1 Tax=Aquatica leii TaxID=1421715 RepID=A0AAN7P9V8_9COLE|nr:hypothetical protein RN001_007709 [Aquatica leii]